ncbi:MAG: trypsin-like serine protease [Pseudobdellovibrionaceae bacterium]
MKEQILKVAVGGFHLSWLSLSVLLVACGGKLQNKIGQSFKTSDQAIVSGEAVLENAPEAASTVALYMKVENRPNQDIGNFCTGALLSSRIVVTAAHCLADLAAELKLDKTQMLEKISVGFGAKVLTSVSEANAKLVKIKNYVVHPDYKVDDVISALDKPMSDIALILLEEAAPATAKPVKVVADQAAVQPGLVVTLAGFGLTDGLFETGATSLNKVQVQIRELISATQWGYLVEDRRSACRGDSGGPAYMELSNGELGLVGVTSWGDGLCINMGVYTSVPVFVSWIQTAAAQL